jgi:NADH oxidase (H2O2-forming)
MTLPQRIVIIGGSAAGMGAAGATQQIDPDASITVFTGLSDAAYSPCGIPHVHGREIDSFDRLVLQDKDFYRNRGIDIHYETTVDAIDLERREIAVQGMGRVPYDSLVLGTGFAYETPAGAGVGLDGISYVRGLKHAREWDKLLDEVKVAVVVEAQPIGVEMATALARRGIETHLVDPHPWPMAEIADPDIMEPVEESWRELGVKMHFNTLTKALVGDGHVRAVRTSAGELPADIAVMGTKKLPNTQLAEHAGIKAGSTGGISVDPHMATSAPGVWAAGDCIEVPQGSTGIPVQGLSGSHAYAQGKIAGANAAGGHRAYQPVHVPWGLVGGNWMIGGISFGETLAQALGIPYVLGVGEEISRARYYPDYRKIRVKLLADPKTHKIIGAQLVGGEGIKERCDLLALAGGMGSRLLTWRGWKCLLARDGRLNEPVALAAQNAISRAR